MKGVQALNFKENLEVPSKLQVMPRWDYRTLVNCLNSRFGLTLSLIRTRFFESPIILGCSSGPPLSTHTLPTWCCIGFLGEEEKRFLWVLFALSPLVNGPTVKKFIIPTKYVFCTTCQGSGRDEQIFILPALTTLKNFIPAFSVVIKINTEGVTFLLYYRYIIVTSKLCKRQVWAVLTGKCVLFDKFLLVRLQVLMKLNSWKVSGF